MKIYRIETPSGYLLRRTACPTIAHARQFAANHYSVFTIEEETNPHWLKAYRLGQVSLKKFRSIAHWPTGAIGFDNDISTDEHDTEAEAQGVCDLLRRNGLGGDGKVFPLSTAVQPILPVQPSIHTSPPWDNHSKVEIGPDTFWKVDKH